MTDPMLGPICPMCHEARLGAILPQWYVPYTADSSPRDRVQRGMPVGVRTCPRCEHLALFLPPTLDAPPAATCFGPTDCRFLRQRPWPDMGGHGDNPAGIESRLEARRRLIEGHRSGPPVPGDRFALPMWD